MESTVFGIHLLRKGLITRQQLLNALEYQCNINKKMADFAIKKGFLTKEQIDQLFNDSNDDILYFGDLAVKNGFLSEDQVDELLEHQLNTRIYIGDALVSIKAITQERMEEELLEFMMTSHPTAFQNNENSVLEDLTSTLKEVSIKCFSDFAGLKILDTKFNNDRVTKEDFDIIAKVTMYGDFTCEMYLCTSNLVAKEIAEISLNMEVDETDQDLLNDTISEMVSIISGNLSTELSYTNMIAEISLPFVFHKDDLEADLSKEESKIDNIEFVSEKSSLVLSIIR